MRRVLGKGLRGTLAFLALISLLGACAKIAPNQALLPEYLAARLSFNAGKFAEAESEALSLIKRHRGFRPARLLAAQAAYYKGDPAACLRYLASLRGDEAPVALLRARALRATGKADAARAVIEEAISRDPDNPRLLALAARLSADRGDEAARRAYLERATVAAGELSLAFSELASVRWAEGDGAETLRLMDAAVALAPYGSLTQASLARKRGEIQAKANEAQATACATRKGRP